MIAFINNVVAGAGVTLLAYAKLNEAHRGLAIPFGIATAVLLSGVFLAYQRWRFETFEKAGPLDGSHTDDQRAAPDQPRVMRRPASSSSTSPVVLAAAAPSHQAASATSSGVITASSAARAR